MTRPRTDPLTVCLDRTRSAVMTVLALDGLGIALSGILLRQRGAGVSPWDPVAAFRWSHLALLGLMILGTAARLLGAARPVLEDPDRRPGRFFWSHVAGACCGTMALPLGFAYAWSVRPELGAVGPFWAVAVVLGLLALPRRDELEGFPRPISPARGPYTDDTTGAPTDDLP